MLRCCIRQLCRSIANPSGLSSSSKEFLNESLLGHLEPYIPHTFTALTQISRTIDEDLMEQVGAAGGLRHVLDNCPEKFLVSKIGSVYVARRQNNQKRKTQAAENKLVVKPMVNRARKVHLFKGNPPPAVVFERFPTFFVPVSAIETLDHQRNNASESESVVAESVSNCINENREFLDVVSIAGKTFVRLIPGLAESAEAFEESKEKTNGKESLISHRLESHEVPPYEQFRVARLIPTCEQFFPISSEMRESAVPLIASGRDLLHVFISAPQLFDLREQPSLAVRFLLDPNFRPPADKSAAALKEALDCLGKKAVRANGMRVAVDRRKRRALRNQLQYALNPLPHFDQRVMAHAIFDLLPLDGPIAVSKVLSLLPEEVVRCVPPNLYCFLGNYSYLFTTLDWDREMLIQRADIPKPEERSVSSITSEEILMSVFNIYPRRRHPSVGTCIIRCRDKLPKLVRHRLRQIDFVEDVLRKHPDKVEVLDAHDAVFAKTGNTKSSGNSRCFRFVGEWQEELVKEYENLCAKYKCDPNTTLDLMSV